MIDTSTSRGARAADRLNREPVIWLTTVRSNGQPQTSPVWFLFEGGEFLIYSRKGTARTGNLATNPRVSLNLDGNGRGGDIVSIEGEARVDPNVPPAHEYPAYVEKYSEYIARHGWTPESFAADYPVPIRVTPARYRIW